VKRSPLDRRSGLKPSPGPARTAPMKRTQPRRDWTAARAKCDAEGCCRNCGNDYGIEAAHVWGREADEPRIDGGSTLWVKPSRIIPLCSRCHREYDAHRLDALPLLTTEEQVQLTRDAGGIVSAFHRATGVYPVGERRAA
jgi:5-methylcytosine-specific restriction endonuclease McrA